MTLTPAPDDELDRRHRVAADAVAALVLAGLPARLVGPYDGHAPGVDVEVDRFEDEAGGVFASWSVGGPLIGRIEAPVLARDVEHPDLRLFNRVGGAMQRAVRAVLLASGFEVVDTVDEYRSFSVTVLGRSTLADPDR